MAKQTSAPSSLPRPTDSELAIMRVLWDRGPSSVREVLEALNAKRSAPLAYTTVLSFLQIMTEKRLVVREEKDRGHVYESSVPAERTKRQLVSDLIDRAFAGSAQELVLQALGARKVSARELSKIRELIEEMGGSK